MDFSRKKMRLGDILIEQGVITPEQLRTALTTSRETGKRLGEYLVDSGITTEIKIARALEFQLGFEYIDLSTIQVPEEVLKLVKPEVLKKYCCIPVAINENRVKGEVRGNVLLLAMSDPMDILASDDIAMITGMKVVPLVATTSDVMGALDRYFGSSQAMDVARQYAEERGFDREVDEITEESAELDNSPIVVLVRTMIEQAARQRTSDIHIEALEERVRVRFRIDGALYERMSYDIKLLPAIVARIKIIGGMDIAEKRKPQDGRITIMVDRNEYDIRVNILPTVHGEKIVMRLQNKKSLNREKKMLGFEESEMKKFDRILNHPHGIVLVTGPTGSGKSTTLYTALSELNREDINIITVEDPVEANVDGINQVHVNPKVDLTFASALRAILRQDPDIIMIGEIRDGETAEIAVKAAITGHLVVSTLHTNSAASTITRLEDMGIENYLIADSVVGIIAQRLVRRLCPDCKKAVEAEEEDKMLLGLDITKPFTVYAPGGCHACENTGYRGRIGVYEIMEVTGTLKNVIAKGADAEDIKQQALKEGMNTLAMAAGLKVKQGITSMNELRRIVYEA